jgi:hypothetical protein
MTAQKTQEQANKRQAERAKGDFPLQTVSTPVHLLNMGAGRNAQGTGNGHGAHVQSGVRKGLPVDNFTKHHIVNLLITFPTKHINRLRAKG